MGSLAVRLARIVATSAVIASGGCGPDPGTPPIITEFALSQGDYRVNRAASLAGQLRFEDPDRNVRSFVLSVTPPGGTEKDIATRVLSVDGSLNGLVTFDVPYTPKAAGEHQATVRVADAIELVSDPARRPFTVAP